MFEFTAETIATLGFPIVMCLYFMFYQYPKMEKAITNNTEAITDLRELILQKLK